MFINKLSVNEPPKQNLIFLFWGLLSVAVPGGKLKVVIFSRAKGVALEATKKLPFQVKVDEETALAPASGPGRAGRRGPALAFLITGVVLRAMYSNPLVST